MLPRNAVALLVVCFFILSLCAPVYSSSGSMRYDKYYDLEGKILLKIQAGDKGSSPAQHKTLVEGRGAFERGESIYMDSNRISVQTDSDWSVSDVNLRGLKVGSAVKLNQDLGDLSEEQAEQVFAVMMETDPGEEGHLVQDWSAAEAVYNDDLFSQFVIDQDAYTSGGQMKRYIDLVCPASQVYLFEDAVIDGYARVIDSLQPAGSEDGGSEIKADEQSLAVEGEQEEGQEAKGDSDSEEKGLFTPHLDKEAQGENNKDSGGEVYVLESDQFATTVPLGTPLEEIKLHQTITLSTEVIEITGVEVKWDHRSIPDYDPDQEGSYIFTGKLIFPDDIVAPGNIYILYTVHVLEDLEKERPEEEKGEE